MSGAQPSDGLLKTLTDHIKRAPESPALVCAFIETSAGLRPSVHAINIGDEGMVQAAAALLRAVLNASEQCACAHCTSSRGKAALGLLILDAKSVGGASAPEAVH